MTEFDSGRLGWSHWLVEIDSDDRINGSDQCSVCIAGYL